MKKSNLITGILYVLFGMACLIVALLIETKLEGILWGFAGAGIFPGIMMICKYFYWSSPKNKEQYEERLENDRIEQHDELKTKIRDIFIQFNRDIFVRYLNPKIVKAIRHPVYLIRCFLHIQFIDSTHDLFHSVIVCHHIIRLILRVNFKTDIVCVFGVERKYAVIVAKIGDSRDDQDQTENAKKFFLHRWQPP